MSSILNFNPNSKKMLKLESLVNAFSDMENPFREDSMDLISLETSQIMVTDIVESVMTEKDNVRNYVHFFFRDNYDKKRCMVILSSSQ